MASYNLRCFLYLSAITLSVVLLLTFRANILSVSVQTVAVPTQGSSDATPDLGIHSSVSTNETNRVRAGCKFPSLPLWPPEMKHLFKRKTGRIRCRKEPNWVYTRLGIFYISDRAEKAHGNVKCKHAPLVFQNDFKISARAETEPIGNGSLIKYDYFSVRCVGSDKKVYTNIHAAIPLLPANNNNNTTPRDGARPLDVVMLTFDSISRLNWMRNLPKSHKYFVDELGATVLKGYNIMGDGTGGALFPILTGRWKDEVPNAIRGVRGAVTVDRYPWIWRAFKDEGYSVMYAEDGAHIGMWTYQRKGFGKKPVDHYMRIFYKVVENRYGYANAYCLGSIPRHTVLLQHVRDYLETNRSPKFAYLFHNQLSHDSYNAISMIDDDLMFFLKSLKDDGFLNNTVFILNSDHGARFTNIRRVLQGKWEERMPYFAMYLPEWFRKEYPRYYSNLQVNSKRLATTFDVHETLHHLVRPDRPAPHNTSSLRGRSLFTKIPLRTCEDGQIPPHYCACMEWNPVAVNDTTLLNNISKAFVDYANALTSPYRELCAVLSVTKIEDSKVSAPRKEILAYKRFGDFSDKTKVNVFFYQLRLATAPNNGRYELTVRYNTMERNITIDSNAVSRIDPYGTQPHCISDKDRRLNFYCYCKS